MVTSRLGQVIRHLRGVLDDATDGQLLERFLAGREEQAFEALVRRHGPMVLGVCQRVLGNAHDAEDAFQAAFLVLARRAASIRQRGALGSWLYGVARHVALHAKRAAARRRAKEAQAMPRTESRTEELREVLDRELECLPEKYRAPVVLCDLEGRTRQEAARQLGLPPGTVASRLARGRSLLARRLARRGVSLSGGALAVVLTESATAAVPVSLVSSTVRAAVLVAAGQAAAVTTPAVILMKEVQKVMFLTKLKFALAAVMVVGLLGTGGVVYRAAGEAPRAAERPPADRPLSELELLRREVEILKLQVEVLQSEMRSLKGRPTAEKTAAPDQFSNRFSWTYGPPRAGAEAAADPFAGQPHNNPYAVNAPDSTVEDELKKLRDATDDPVLRAHLGRILIRLREQARPKSPYPVQAK